MQLPFLVLTAFVITRWVIVRYREAGVISIYEYLERRIHVSSRILASLVFIIFSIGRTAIVLYLPALAFSTVCGVDLTTTIIVMGVIITLYTVLGGIEAVVWTDAVQVCIFTFAAVYTIFAIFSRLGDTSFVQVANQYGKLKVLLPGANPFKITTLWLVLETVVQTIRIYGTQQDMAQRYMTADSLKSAQKSVWLAAVSYIPICFMFYFIGVSLFVFYVTNVDPGILLIEDGTPNYIMKADTVYPYFIATQLPRGLAGLLIAAIFAAAMSSIDSLMNSASTVCIEDFYKRFWVRNRDDSHYLRTARALTVVWGASATCLALGVFHRIDYAQKAWSIMQAVLGSGMLGLMALAFLPFRVDRWAAGIAFVASFVLVLCLKIEGSLIWLVLPVIGNLTCFLGALGLNAVMGRRESQRA